MTENQPTAADVKRQLPLPGPIESAVTIGLATGLLEAALWLAAKALNHYTHRDPELTWAAPLGLALASALAVIPLLPLSRRYAFGVRRAALGLATFIGVGELSMIVGGLHPVARILLAGGIGVQVAMYAGRHPAATRALVRRGLRFGIAATVLVFGVQQALDRYQERQALARIGPARTGTPNILLLVFDTMRASAMSLYGAERPTTPNLATFAREGVVFSRAYSPSSWTLPSHSSMFTGRDAHELAADWAVPLPAGTPTLAEVLSSQGYLTAGFAGNPRYTTRESGLDRGFGWYRGSRMDLMAILTKTRLYGALTHWIGEVRHSPIPPGDHRYPVQEIAADLLAWLPKSRDRPWFAFVNLYDAHDPYLPSPRFARQFRTPGAGGRNPFLENQQPVSPGEAAAERDAYDATVAELDDHLGRLLDSLRARQALENTIVVIVGDHGELFGEHGLLNHGNSLYPGVLQVPLVIVWPGHVPAGVRVADAVSARNIAATLLELGGLGTALPGRSLAGYWDGRATAPDTVLVSARRAALQPDWHPIGHGDMAGVIVGKYQLIRSRDGAEEAFDLSTDPLGLHPIDPNSVPGIGALRAAIPAGAIRH